MHLQNSENHPNTPLMVKDISGENEAFTPIISSYKSSRFAHSWIITGPKGIGKAELAIRAAHYILSNPDPLTAPEVIDPQTPSDTIYSQIQAGSHPDLLTLRRGLNAQTGRLKQDISVNDARKVSKFFSRRATGGGWRICIIDTADDLNRASGNALLKIVEEPPEKSLILFISNSLGRLLPTLRSRCRVLKCAPLSENDLTQALSDGIDDTPLSDLNLIVALSEGSLTRAYELVDGGLEIYQSMMACLETLPSAEWNAINKFISTLSGAANRDNFTFFSDALKRTLQRLAINTVNENWDPVLEREGQLSQKWHLNNKLEELSEFTLWLETSLQERVEYNLDPTLTATQIFHQLAALTKSGIRS